MHGLKAGQRLDAAPRTHSPPPAATLIPASNGALPEPGLEWVRPQVRGKFLWAGSEKLLLRGVTYGTFRPDASGLEFHDRDKVERDFAAMAVSHINSVRVYTVPPVWLLDLAQRHGLRVLVGLPWEQHVAFLENRRQVAGIVARLREAVRSCSGHPAILAYAIGNEIPASIVRWHGAKRIENFLKRLFDAAKSEDPTALVTYVNFPTTEYLRLPFLDFDCFNVYLESRDALKGYLARLQNLSGNRPLVMAEVGLDSTRHGEAQQAETLVWQVRETFESGCAGVYLFAWTDEWHRGGFDIEDWDFGLTTRDRLPKPALEAVAKVFASVPFDRESAGWPRISVVLCSFNGSETIGEALQHLARLNYPDYEVIVVDDGSTDNTAAIAAGFPFRLIRTPNQGLSAARNMGLEAASGSIVAYIDDDAYPDPDWLAYLAHTFRTSNFVGVGGPNISPPGDGPIAECVALSPGGPAHVLLNDTVAEHIPGCNMSFRKDRLKAIGGFDPKFRVAADDVDVCWRLQARGWELGFNPAAVVWHHRRNSVRAYWKQQSGYGKGEALLHAKWPEKYNEQAHLSWAGRVYGPTAKPLLGWLQRVYHGVWGTAPFQSLYERHAGAWTYVPLLPEWYLLLLLLMVLGGVGLLWPPLLWFAAAFASGLALTLLQALENGFETAGTSLRQKLLIALLHVIQPLARLTGRVKYGIVPWRVAEGATFKVPVPRQTKIWFEQWSAPEQRLEFIESELRRSGVVVERAGPFDRWDLHIMSGMAGGVRLSMTVEEHGAGRQLLRFRTRPRVGRAFALMTAGFAAFALAAASTGAPLVAVLILGGITAAFAIRLWLECGWSSSAAERALEYLGAGTGACEIK